MAEDVRGPTKPHCTSNLPLPMDIRVGQKPLWSNGAINHIQEFLENRRSSAVLEFGSGGSTVFLAQRCQQLISIEHDPQWATAVSERLEELDLSASSEVLLHDRPYSSALGIFLYMMFDLIIVDGRDRVDCIQRNSSRVKPGGALVLDDSQRKRYQSAHTELAHWTSTTYADTQRQTTIWTRPSLRQEELTGATLHHFADARYFSTTYALARRESTAGISNRFTTRSPVRLNTRIQQKFAEKGKIPRFGNTVSPRLFEIPQGSVYFPDQRKYIFDNKGNIIEEASIHAPEQRIDSIDQISHINFIRAGTCADLTAPGAALYSFFLLESLPKLGIIQQAKFKVSDIDVFYVNSTNSFTLSALERLGIDRRQIKRRSHESIAIKAENLLTCNNIRSQRKTPSWVRYFLHDLFLNSRIIRRKAARKIYISREKAHGRRIANINEVRTVLDKYGIEEIFAEDYSIFEIADVLQESWLVIGPHGAGLANIIFARPGTKVIELVGSHFSPQYKLLCEDFDLDYDILECTNLAGQRLLDFKTLDAKQVAMHNRDDIIVSIEELERVLMEAVK